MNRRIVEIHLPKHGISNFGVEQLTNHMVDNFTLLHLDLSWLVCFHSRFSSVIMIKKMNSDVGSSIIEILDFDLTCLGLCHFTKLWICVEIVDLT